MSYFNEYRKWLKELKGKINSLQVKAAIAVNATLIQFYWDLGRTLGEKTFCWGEKLIEQLAKDLKSEFPDMKGFSLSNLKYCKRFYEFYSNIQGETAGGSSYSQLVTQIPWGQNILIFTKSKTVEEASFYLSKTMENNWSRETLAIQLKSNLYHRTGKIISNFKETLPLPFSELAQETLKDPYVFDFLTISKDAREKDIENSLIQHLSKLMLELGKGFAFVGRQVRLELAGKEYFIDLLFYNFRLKCFVVIELKNADFFPEFTGKMNFYLSAVDALFKQQDDKPTIGIVLCREKNNIEVEFALRDLNKPIGVSEFQVIELLQEEIKQQMPTIEELEEELSRLER